MKRKTTESSAEIMHFDEANVARLGLISIQERIPVGFTSWTVDFSLDGRPARLSCVAVSEHGGVPHGLDNDVSLALIALFQEAGCPGDGTIVTTAYRILTLIGWDTSGHYYQALKESLERLATATFTASKAWRSGKRWITVKFRYIDRLEYTSDDDRLGLSSRSILKIRLAREIVESIRGKYIKPLDLQLLTSLERPLTRALYRLLDAQRVLPDGREVMQFRVNIIEWAKACKIVDQTPARVRRTLEGAHTELVERGYLSEVRYEGRGSAQEIIYVFARVARLSQEALEVVAQLGRYGVARPVAQDLINAYGLERLKERIARFEAILQAGYTPRNRAGFLVDVVRDEEGKYADPAGFISHASQARHQATPRKPSPVQQAQPEEFADWQGLDLRGRAEKALKILGLMLGKSFPTAYYGALMEAFEAGVLDPLEVTKAAIKAQIERRITPFAEELARLLGE